jgi:YidC/Oxa1 family membrane protein insertase
MFWSIPVINLDWIYIAISWILLKWHSLWALALGPESGIAWVLSIVFLVITVRVILFPVFMKQIKSQRAMQALQPQVKELQKKYKNDRETLQKEMMELYRREKANPLMGCLPLLLQIPVFLGLFHVLRGIDPLSVERPKIWTTQYGWTMDQFLGASQAKLLGAPIAAQFNSTDLQLQQLHASGVTVKIVAACLIAIMVATTYITQRQMIARTPNADPQQAMIQKLMLYGIPLSLLISGSLFPIGVVVYWVTQNLFSMGQQFYVLHKHPPAGAAAKDGDKKPEDDKPSVGQQLAPKPGAKPVNPKKGPRPATAVSKADVSLDKTTEAKPAPKKGSRPKGKGQPSARRASINQPAANNRQNGRASGAKQQGTTPRRPTDSPAKPDASRTK